MSTNESPYQRNMNNSSNSTAKQFVIRDPIVPDGTRGFRGFENENGARNLNAKQ